MRNRQSAGFATASLLWLCVSSAWCQTETTYERSMKQQRPYELQQQNARQQQQSQEQQQAATLHLDTDHALYRMSSSGR